MPVDLDDHHHYHHHSHNRPPDPAPASSLPPSPGFNPTVKHTRQRSASWGPTFVSTTVVPAPNQNEALNSLINSLTALTQSAKEQLASVQQFSDPSPTDRSRKHYLADITANQQRPTYPDHNPAIDDLIESISKSAGLFSQEAETLEDPYYDSEEDAAPAPVAGYAQKKQARSRAASKDSRSFSRLGSKPFEVEGGRSTTSLRPGTSASVRSVGIPSIYRGRNGSVASDALSTLSRESKSKKSLKKLFSSRNRRDVGNYTMSSQSPEPGALRQQQSRSSLRNEVQPPMPARPATPPQHVRNTSTISEASSPATPKTFTPLNPSLRGELNDHLIPSRRSSIRHAPGASRSSHQSSSSRDLKSLNIDEELIEGDNSTVRRIRELQQAREKRHSEWRREARKSDKAAKRMSMPSPKPSKRANSMHSSRHSMSDARPDTSEQNGEPKVGAQIDGSDLAALPAFVEVQDGEPLTPTDSSPDRKRNLSGSPISTLANSKKTKRLSGGVRRSLSLRQSGADDFKSVSDEVDSFLNAPRLTQRIRHPRTGRTIAFSEVGDPNGFVVLCCVGMGLTRYVTTFYDEVAKTQRLRIITPDRPGVGESSPIPEGTESPLAWVDDVAVICSTLGVEKFSLLAHSAGAIYALATALKMPQYVRGRIHLLGPWIPPSQLANSGREGEIKPANLPTSHRLLSMLPVSFMKAANSRFLSTASASIEPKTKKDLKREQMALAALAVDVNLANEAASVTPAEMNRSMLPTPDATPQRPKLGQHSESDYVVAQSTLRSPPLSPSFTPDNRPIPSPGLGTPVLSQQRALTPQARQNLFNVTLTRRTWSLATLNSNPALDLIICFERRRPIAFNYTDVVRAVVIHHGRKDTRVPLENVSWLSSAMRRCELRVLEDEGHGLMASAKVMSNVLTEIGREWEEWSVIAKDKEKRRKEKEQAREMQEKERERELRRGIRSR